MAALRPITSSCAIAIMIAVVALELCMRPVNMALARIPSKGVLAKSASILIKYSDSFSGATPSFIISIPRNNNPNPSKI